MLDFTHRLKAKATQMGFAAVGVTAAAAPGRLREFHSWLDSGYAGSMHYLEQRRDAYTHPRHVLDGCRSIVMLALPYPADPVAPEESAKGTIARYARGKVDYHDLIHRLLKDLKSWVTQQHPTAQVRGIVDTAPLLERDVAEAAGLGWIGKNTLLLNQRLGSYFFLSALLTDLTLHVDEPLGTQHCGTCTACLDACPTNAFVAPYVMDARRCISYVSIEHRGIVEHQDQQQLEGWIFGCDVCQEVCPWNRKISRDPSLAAVLPELASDRTELDLADVLRLDDDEFRARFRKTPMWRSRRSGLLRNAILLVVTGNQTWALPRLRHLLHDKDATIRYSAAWALVQLDRAGTIADVRKAAADEADTDVQQLLERLIATEEQGTGS